MVHIGTKKFFTVDDVERRNETIQRAINLMTDPDKFDQFDLDMNKFLDKFEMIHGTNEKIKHLNLQS